MEPFRWRMKDIDVHEFVLNLKTIRGQGLFLILFI